MRINLRKALALMLSLLMLCTLIPLGAMTVSAADNLVSNGTFETDTSGWSTSSTITRDTSDPASGSASLKLDCTTVDYAWTYVKVSVAANTDYVLTFKGKTANAGLMVNFQSNWTSIADQIPRYTVGSVSSWTDCEYEFNTGTYTSLMIYFQSSWAMGTGSYVWIDDVSITAKEVAEPETPVGNNLVVNGDFEDSTNGWSTNSYASVVTGGYSGNAIQLNNPSSTWGELARQDITVEANETYTLTWRSKRVSGTGVFNMNISKAPYDGTTPTITHVTNYTWMNDTSGNWIEHKATLKMTDSNGNGISQIMIKLTNEAASPGVILIDDICLTKNLTASFDGYIYNGDFELGTIENWTGYNETTASTAAAYNGYYGAHLKGNGSWGGIMYQSTVNVVAGKTYIVSYYIKVLANGMNIQIKDGTTSSGSVLASKTHAVSSDWVLVTHEVAPSQNGLFINFCGLGSSSSAVSGKEESAYVDDIKVELKGGNPEDKIVYGGSSVRDEAAGDGEDETGKGLAFQFSVSATESVKNYDNTYEANSGKISLGDVKYDLVRMGAVMTNNATVGQSADDFTLDAVNNTKVINIPATYLYAVGEETVTFAVRILDIPDRHIGTAIYARPYYVYLENGEEVIVYGQIRSNNYAKAANISTADKSSIKILSIGHSFSKDVMVTNLYNMFKEGGYEEVVIGYLYMAGCSMPKHLYNIENSLAQYEYAKNSTGTWVTKNNVTALSALQEEEWDFVTVQSSPDYIGGQTISSITLGVNSEGDKIEGINQTEYEAMGEITDWILANATNADVKIDYHMIWSFSEGCNLWSYTYHNYDQMTMYTNIVNITQQKVQNHEDINRIIPSATAIQNARSSFMGDNFNMPDATQGGSDGYHLNDDGDYVAALTWYCHYSGESAQVMAGYTGVLSTEEFQAVAEAVDNAIDIPYAVTESTHK